MTTDGRITRIRSTSPIAPTAQETHPAPKVAASPPSFVPILLALHLGYGNSSVLTNGADVFLQLNPATNNQAGSFILDELTPGAPVASFMASFKLRIGDGSAEPADGLSFNFAPDLPNAATRK